MPFKTHSFIHVKRVLAVSTCLIGLAVVAQTARAPRAVLAADAQTIKTPAEETQESIERTFARI